jgi:hypothetical protein
LGRKKPLLQVASRKCISWHGACGCHGWCIVYSIWVLVSWKSPHSTRSYLHEMKQSHALLFFCIVQRTRINGCSGWWPLKETLVPQVTVSYWANLVWNFSMNFHYGTSSKVIDVMGGWTWSWS